jgi:hypothetical protein
MPTCPAEAQSAKAGSSPNETAPKSLDPRTGRGKSLVFYASANGISATNDPNEY